MLKIWLTKSTVRLQLPKKTMTSFTMTGFRTWKIWRPLEKPVLWSQRRLLCPSVRNSLVRDVWGAHRVTVTSWNTWPPNFVCTEKKWICTSQLLWGHSSGFESAVCLFQLFVVLLDDRKYWKNKPQVEKLLSTMCPSLPRVSQSVTLFSLSNQPFSFQREHSRMGNVPLHNLN